MKLVKMKTSGITLIEMLLAFLMLIIIVSGISTAIVQIVKRTKQVELNNKARELLERVKSEIYLLDYNSFNNLSIAFPSGICSFGTQNESCSFEPNCYENPTYYPSNCWALSSPRCLYCLKDNDLEPILDNTDNCSSGYAFKIGYTLAEVKVEIPEGFYESIGKAICIRLDIIDHITNQTKTFHELVFKRKE